MSTQESAPKIPNPLELTRMEIQALVDEVLKNIYDAGQSKLNFTDKKKLWLPILKGKNWSQLKKLILEDCDIEAKHIKQLILMDLSSLEYLKLNDNNLGNEGVQILLAKLPSKLKQLWLWRCQITELRINQGVEFASLTQLRLFKNKIGRKGIEILAKAQFPALAGLGLRKCLIETEAAKSMGKSNFPNLQAIDLRQNQISADGFSVVYQMPWTKLKQIGIDEHVAGILGCMNIVKVKWPLLQASNLTIDYRSRSYLHRQCADTLTQIVKRRFSRA